MGAKAHQILFSNNDSSRACAAHRHHHVIDWRTGCPSSHVSTVTGTWPLITTAFLWLCGTRACSASSHRLSRP